MDKVVITWQELENVAPIQIEGQSLCAFIMQSLVAFSFNGILLGSYNIISKKYNWQTKKTYEQAEALQIIPKQTRCRKCSHNRKWSAGADGTMAY